MPTISSLSPSSASAGGSAFTLTVNGTNFVNGSIVRWNGSDRTTSYVNSTQLTASINAGDIGSAGSASVTVFNPSPGGGTSNAATFTITGGGSGPTPGHWVGSTSSSEFYVTTDGAYVKNHSHNVSIPGCGVIKVTRLTSEPIVSNHYSFSGAYYADGTFTSTTTANVTDGFSNYYSTTCGVTFSAGPWTRVHSWTDSSQAIVPATIVGPATAESLQNSNSFSEEVITGQQP